MLSALTRSAPKLVGYKIYCTKKFLIGISFIKNKLKIKKIENKLPKKRYNKFLLFLFFAEKK